MPSARFTNVLIANEVVQNIMAGSQFEFVGRPARVQVYSLAEATEDVSIEVFFGQELQLSNSPLNMGAAATLGPTVPDDLIVDDIAAPGDRITIRLTET
ncbi:unnamed protein product, partial [marine sediment metagenome]